MFSRRTGRHDATGGLTRTQQLREAKSASRMKDFERKADPRPAETPRRRVKSRYEPKKLDFSKPGLTKAMLARVKHAEKVKEEYERKTIVPGRMPKRTPAPVAGDARLGRERSFRRRSVSPPSRRYPSPPRVREHTFAERSTRRPDLHTSITEKAAELAKSMTADILESEPIGSGVIDSVVIPPGVVNEDRTTVVTIPQPTSGTGGDLNTSTASQVANRSIQVISESLDEQDAAESDAVNQRLADLQQARRDFVIAVATVGGNSINIPDAGTPPGHLMRVPSLEDEVEYTLDPAVQAARDYAARDFEKSMKEFREERGAARRMEEEFERFARETVTDDLRLDVPFEEDIFRDPDISWEEDETGLAFPIASRSKAHASPVTSRHDTHRYDSYDPEDLEKFFDVQRYPPCPGMGPPPGRETLHPDLWELEDPWYRAPPPPDVPDLIQFSREETPDLIQFSR